MRSHLIETAIVSLNTKFRFGRWIAPIIVVVIVLLSFSKILFHENYVLIEGADLTGQYYPLFNAAAYWFQNRTPLLWDPYVFSGKANTGDPQTGIFYPLYWLFWAWHFTNGQLPPEALEALIVLNFCLMSLFIYFLARTIGISKHGSVIAGIVGGLGGLSSKIHSWLSIQSSYVWLPLVILFYYKAVKSSSRKTGYAFLLLSALCLAISFLAGHHQPQIQAALVLGMFTVYLKISKQHPKDGIPLLPGLLIVGVIAALLAAIQIFPSVEWGMQAYRWVGADRPIPGEERIPYYILENTENVHPQDFLSLVVPYASTTANLYVGSFVILLAFAGAIFSEKKEARFFLIAAILFLLFSLGKYSIVHTWLYTYVPGMWFAREALQCLIPFSICIAVLAGFGLDAIAEGFRDPSNEAIRRFTGFMIQLIGIILAIFFAISTAAVMWDDSFLKDPRILKSVRLTIYLVLICILLAFLYYRKISTSLFQIIAVLIIVVDLGSEISRAIPLAISNDTKAFTPINVYRDNELANTIKKYQVSEMFRVDDLAGVLPPNAGDAWFFYTTGGYTPTINQHYLDLRESGWGQFSNPSALLNTRYFISPAQLDSVELIWNQENVGLYRNPRAVSRVFSSKRIKIFSEKEKLFQFMNSPLFNPLTTVLFLKDDWNRVPSELKQKLKVQSIDFDMSRTEFSKAEQNAIHAPLSDVQSMYAKPWGWDPGDTMSGTFSLNGEINTSLMLNYFAAETDCNLVFELKKDALQKTEQIPLKKGSAQNLTQSEVNLGGLTPGEYQFQLMLPESCISKLDSVEIISTDSKINNPVEFKILSYKPQEIRISSSSKTPELLILSEMFYPGWIAKIDGKKIPIHRVDYALMAVGIEAGEHTIEFHFRPLSVYSGLAVSAITLALVSFYLWSQRKHWIVSKPD